jgi:peroxiredoxin
MKKLVLCALVACGAYVCNGQRRDTNILVYRGDTVPSFEVFDKHGEKVSSDIIKDSYALLLFFRTDCSHCQHELPEVQELYNKYSNRDDFKLLAMSEMENPKDVEAFFVSNGYTMPFHLDATGDVLRKFVVRGGWPRSFLVDKRGVVIESVTGYSKDTVSGRSNFDIIRSRVERILR